MDDDQEPGRAEWLVTYVVAFMVLIMVGVVIWGWVTR